MTLVLLVTAVLTTSNPIEVQFYRIELETISVMEAKKLEGHRLRSTFVIRFRPTLRTARPSSARARARTPSNDPL